MTKEKLNVLKVEPSCCRLDKNVSNILQFSDSISYAHSILHLLNWTCHSNHHHWYQTFHFAVVSYLAHPVVTGSHFFIYEYWIHNFHYTIRQCCSGKIMKSKISFKYKISRFFPCHHFQQQNPITVYISIRWNFTS